MTTNIIFGNIVYNIDSDEGSTAFLRVLHAQAMSYPQGTQGLIIASVEGKNAEPKKRRRKNDKNKERTG